MGRVIPEDDVGGVTGIPTYEATGDLRAEALETWDKVEPIGNPIHIKQINTPFTVASNTNNIAGKLSAQEGCFLAYDPATHRVFPLTGAEVVMHYRPMADVLDAEPQLEGLERLYGAEPDTGDDSGDRVAGERDNEQ